MNKLYVLILSLLSYTAAFSQLGFCTGSSGAPIFLENFGSGSDYGPPLPAGVTNYAYVNSGFPSDGQYTLFNRTNLIPNSQNWHFSLDHTPDNQPDGANGKMLIVNASNTPGQFYRRVVTGLCSNTTFEFSAWLLNILNISVNPCGTNARPINVTFEIWNATDTILLRTASTGNINGTTSPIWNQFGLIFTMPSGDTSVILKMRNNGVGGCGNDLAIDDIMFSACGDFSNITNTSTTGNSISICENETISNNILTVNTSGSSSNVYQWQQSTDNINFTDITGQTATTYTIPNLTATTFYRVKVARDLSNLNNSFCSTLSQVFIVNYNVLPNPPTSSGNRTACSNQTTGLAVTVGSNMGVNWYSAATNGTLLQSNSLTFTPSSAGTYYAESFNTTTGCRSSARTAVQLLPATTVAFTGSTTICTSSNTDIVLSSSNTAASFSWTAASTNVTGFSNGTGNRIQQTLTATANTTGTIVYRVVSIVNGCEGTPQTITITVNTPQVLTPTFIPIPTTYCVSDTAAALPNPTVSGAPLIGVWNPSTITTSSIGSSIYTFTPQVNGCVAYTPITILIRVTNGQMPNFDNNITICAGTTVPALKATSPNGITGTWNPSVINNSTSSSYVFTPNPNQCAIPQTINVAVSTPTLSTVTLTTTVAFSENQTITVLASGGGDYLYQLDFGDFQTSNIFNNVSSGNHIITIKEVNGCSTPISKDVLIINHPTFFTPNGDGFNDIWRITGINNLTNVQTMIFDRYGKFLKELTTNDDNWDGTYNGSVLPADDYWFTVSFEENGVARTFRSHFTLKR